MKSGGSHTDTPAFGVTALRRQTPDCARGRVLGARWVVGRCDCLSATRPASVLLLLFPFTFAVCDVGLLCWGTCSAHVRTNGSSKPDVTLVEARKKCLLHPESRTKTAWEIISAFVFMLGVMTTVVASLSSPTPQQSCSLCCTP